MASVDTKINILMSYLIEFSSDITKAEVVKIKSRLKKLGVKTLVVSGGREIDL